MAVREWRCEVPLRTGLLYLFVACRAAGPAGGARQVFRICSWCCRSRRVGICQFAWTPEALQKLSQAHRWGRGSGFRTRWAQRNGFRDLEHTKNTQYVKVFISPAPCPINSRDRWWNIRLPRSPGSYFGPFPKCDIRRWYLMSQPWNVFLAASWIQVSTTHAPASGASPDSGFADEYPVLLQFHTNVHVWAGRA